MVKGNRFVTVDTEPRDKGSLTPMRSKRHKTAMMERHEMEMRSDTPTTSRSEYSATVMNFPSIAERSKDIA